MAALVEPHFAALMLHWTPIVLGLHPRHVREHAKDFIGIHAPDTELHVGEHDDGRAREDHVGHFAVFFRRLYPASCPCPLNFFSLKDQATADEF